MGIFQKYSRSIMAFSIALMSVSLVACNDSNNRFSTVDDEETPPPIAALEVTSTAPADNAIDVGTKVKVVAVFNKDVNSETVSDTSFTLQSAGETDLVGNTVSYNALTVNSDNNCSTLA